MPTLEMQIKNILEITNIRTDEYFSSDHLLVILSLLTKVAWSALRHLPWDTLFVDNNIDAYTACWYDFFFVRGYLRMLTGHLGSKVRCYS